MNDTVDEKDGVGHAPPVVSDEDNKEERRADRDLKHWIIKLTATTASIVVMGTTGALLYGYVIQDKDFEGGFIGEIFKGLMEIIKIAFG